MLCIQSPDSCVRIGSQSRTASAAGSIQLKLFFLMFRKRMPRRAPHTCGQVIDRPFSVTTPARMHTHTRRTPATHTPHARTHTHSARAHTHWHTHSARAHTHAHTHTRSLQYARTYNVQDIICTNWDTLYTHTDTYTTHTHTTGRAEGLVTLVLIFSHVQMSTPAYQHTSIM